MEFYGGFEIKYVHTDDVPYIPCVSGNIIGIVSC